MATIGINAGLETLGEVVDDLDQIGQGDFFPRFLQNSFQRFHVRMGLLACFLHQDAPYCVVERVEIGAVGRPFAVGIAPVDVDRDDIGAVVTKEVLSLARFVGWSAVLLERSLVVAKNGVGPWNEVRSEKTFEQKRDEKN